MFNKLNVVGRRCGWLVAGWVVFCWNVLVIEGKGNDCGVF